MDLITTIVPVYNAENTLYDCINSIRGQSYTNFELLLVDDGSTDKSLKICMEFGEKDHRIKVFSKANSGPGSTRNYALSKANGKWITFIDADDWISPDLLKNLYLTAKESNASAVFCNCYYSYSNLDVPVYIYPQQTKLVDSEILKSFLIRSKLRTELWGKLFRKDIIGDKKINENVKVGEDLIFLLELFSETKGVEVTLIPDLLYYYNQQTLSSLTRSSKIVHQNYLLLQEYLKLIERYPAISAEYRNFHSVFIIKTILTFVKKDWRFSKSKFVKVLIREHIANSRAFISKKNYLFFKFFLLSPSMTLSTQLLGSSVKRLITKKDYSKAY